jgi:DTW domain-containing protein
MDILNTRAFCYHCWRPEAVCLCDSVQKIKSPVRIGVLQHPDEHRMPVNTVRLLQLTMPEDVFVTRGLDHFDQDKKLQNELAAIPKQRIGILYPSSDALTPQEAQGEIDLLLLIDGTWDQAKKIAYRNPWLFDYQKIAFTPDAPSRYRIRKEPCDHYVSSLEAAVITLRGLTGNDCFAQEALDLFDTMVERQLEYVGQNRRHRSTRQKAAGLSVPARNRIRKILFGSSHQDRIQWLSGLNEHDLTQVRLIAQEMGVMDLYSLDHIGLQVENFRRSHNNLT